MGAEGRPGERANRGCFTNQYFATTDEKQTKGVGGGVVLISQVTEGTLLQELSDFKVTARAASCNVEEGKQTGHEG